ncbi:MAG: hypothetical protein CMJ41_06855 [Phycisphaerae bacterium]|nr:hypothetical protein [Phycisphaerae bacterium]|tara:strand:+ start:114 stop:617 length:504 start_codon:yes stop_codon:yes gene_type:complete
MTGRDPRRLYESLLQNLESQELAHETMLRVIDESESALRDGKMDVFVEACRRQQGCALGMQRLESEREAIVNSWADVGGDPTIEGIIRSAPRELGDRLRDSIDRLRPLVRLTRQRCTVIRNAVASLTRHLGGLMQGVHGVLGRPGTYGRLGMMARENQLEFNVDLQS